MPIFTNSTITITTRRKPSVVREICGAFEARVVLAMGAITIKSIITGSKKKGGRLRPQIHAGSKEQLLQAHPKALPYKMSLESVN